MAYTYETMDTLIPNAVMRKRLLNGALRSYLIKPADGYVMHDQGMDYLNMREEIDESTGETVYVEFPVMGYRSSEASVGSNYDFTPVQMQDENGNVVTAYGTRQFFCKPAPDIGEGAEIFGIPNTEPKPEVM